MTSLKGDLPSPANLLAFEAAARHGSFTKAGRELNVSQAAVSLAVRHLEADLGTPLFRRRHRGVELTENGRKFYDDVAAGLGRIQRSAHELRRLYDRDHVTLSASTAFASYWMLPRLARFKQRFPEIDLRLQTTDKDLDLASEGISLGIRRGRGDWTEYDGAMFETEEIDAVCSPGFLADGPTLEAPADLLQVRLLHLEEPFRPRPTWSDWFAQFGIAYADTGQGLRLNDYALVLHAAIDGQGVAMGWRHLTDHLVAEGRLVRAVAQRYRSDHGFYLVWPRELNPTDEMIAIRDWMISEGTTVASTDPYHLR